MKVVNHEHTMKVPARNAWDVFADFGGFLKWNTIDANIEVSGEGNGMVRTLDIPGLGRIGERLDHADENTMSLSYTLVEGQPLGMQTYHADISIVPVSDNESRIIWRGDFSGAVDANLDEMANNLTGSYQGMSEALEHYVANQ